MGQDITETITLVIDDNGTHHRTPGGATITTREGMQYMCWQTEVAGGFLVSYLKLEYVRAFECEIRA